MTVRALICPSCGAPLRPASGGAVVCAYCAHVLVDVPDAFRSRPVVVPPWTGRAGDEHRRRIAVGKFRYVLLQRLGQGDTSDVYLARRDARLTELVVLKLLRAPEDAPWLSREVRMLARLHNSGVRGASHFRSLLPQVVSSGRPRGDGGASELATVFRYRSGFDHSLTDVRAAYPQGIDARAGVWMFNRLLEMIGWVHRAGMVHGAILPPHVLIHPRDHGAMIVGWSMASTHPEPVGAISRAHEGFYPDAVLRQRGPVRPRTDVVMAARCIAWLLGLAPGGNFAATGGNGRHQPWAELLLRNTDEARAATDAWSLKERMSAAARESFGPPRYVRFEMPTITRS